MATNEGQFSPSGQNLFIELLTKFWPKNSFLSFIFGAGFLLFVFAFVAMGTLMPGYGYDLIPYLGAVFEANGESIADAHRHAWGAVQQSASADVYANLAENDAYRQRQSSDANAFHSVLPLYTAKIGYIYLIQSVGGSLGWLKSAWWTSHISALLLGLFAFFWMWKQRFLQAAPLVAGLLILANYFDAIRYPGPDIIATTLALIGTYVWLRGRETPALLLFFLAFLFRPDTMLFVFALLLASGIARLPLLKTGITFLTLLVASVAIQQAADHPGWWTHFYFSCVTIQPTLEGFHPDFSLMAYVKGFARGVFMSLTDFNWPMVLTAAGFVTIVLARAGYEFLTRQWAMLLACVLAIGGKFLVFPLPDDRIYMPLVLAMAMILFEVWQPRLGRTV